MKTDRPDWRERICFGFGGIGIRLVPAVIVGFMLIYLTNVAFLDVAACSVIIGVSRAFDGISDIVTGNIIDNTASKLGKARSWLLRMCLPLFVFSILLFRVPPHMPQMLKYLYVFIIYNIVNTGIVTFTQISYFSLISLITDDHNEHTLLGSILSLTRAISVLIGSVIFVRLLEVFTDEPGNQNTQIAYTRAMLVISLAAVVFILITVAGTRERVQVIQKRERKTPIKELISALGMLVKSRYWIILIAIDLMTNMVAQFMATGASYFALYILHDMGKVSLIMLTSMISNIAAIVSMPVLTGSFGKRRVFIAALLVTISGLIGIGLVTPSIKPFLAFNVLYCLGNGMVKGVSFTLIADLVAYSEKMTGEFRPGTGNAGISAAEKLGYGLGVAIFGFVLAAAGFDATLKVQPAAVISAINALYIWIPAVIYIVVLVIFVLFFDFEVKNPNEDI